MNRRKTAGPFLFIGACSFPLRFRAAVGRTGWTLSNAKHEPETEGTLPQGGAFCYARTFLARGFRIVHPMAKSAFIPLT